VSLIAVSGEEPQHEYLKGLAGRLASDTWTLPRTAQLGDDVVFYIKSPIQEFVATGTVQSEPAMNAARTGRDGTAPRSLRSVCCVDPSHGAACLPRRRSGDGRSRPRRYTTVPDVLERQVRHVLGM
jgi:hypothetical protein